MTGNLVDFYARLTPFYYLLYPDLPDDRIQRPSLPLNALHPNYQDNVEVIN